MTNDLLHVSSSRSNYPVTRYGYDDDNGEKYQEPILRSIHDPIPSGASYSGPVYFLTESEYSRHKKYKHNPHAIKGKSNIAFELQTACEATGRDLTPLHIETDRLDPTSSDRVSTETAVRWLTDFVENELSVEVETCTFYHSGGRSLHVHVPRVLLHDQLTEIRNLIKNFNEDGKKRLDDAIYSPKSQFRLPGVEHSNTGQKKVRLDPPYTSASTARAVYENATSSIETYADVLRDVFHSDISNTVTVSGEEDDQQISGLPRTVVTAIFGKQPLLSRTSESKDRVIPIPLIEQKHPPLTGSDEEYNKWSLYRKNEFSPYAMSGGQSMAVITVCGGAFIRPNNQRRILLPAHIYAAIGRDGSFTVFGENRPIQLSKTDFGKRDYTRSEHLIIKGGGSNDSIIHSVDKSTALTTSYYLHQKGREAAQNYLVEQGYDMGKEGPSLPDTASSTQNQSATKTDRKPSRTKRLQELAESGDIDVLLTHDERWYVACRLLKIGTWNSTWNWFAQQYGSRFDPEITYQQLGSAARSLGFDEMVPSSTDNSTRV